MGYLSLPAKQRALLKTWYFTCECGCESMCSDSLTCNTIWMDIWEAFCQRAFKKSGDVLWRGTKLMMKKINRSWRGLWHEQVEFVSWTRSGVFEDFVFVDLVNRKIFRYLEKAFSIFSCSWVRFRQHIHLFKCRWLNHLFRFRRQKCSVRFRQQIYLLRRMQINCLFRFRWQKYKPKNYLARFREQIYLARLRQQIYVVRLRRHSCLVRLRWQKYLDRFIKRNSLRRLTGRSLLV